MSELTKRPNGEPVVAHEHPMPEPFEGAKVAGTCLDTAWIVTDHKDCDVCLMVDQCPVPGDGRHALMRMDAAEARTLGEALIDAASQPTPGSQEGGE